jgi:hypothetical protein
MPKTRCVFGTEMASTSMVLARWETEKSLWINNLQRDWAKAPSRKL